MRIAVDFQDERLEFEVDDERVIAHRSSPDRTASADAGHLTLGAIESPRDYPPLLQAVVPGDRVALPVDPSLPDLTEVLAAVVGVLRRAEVDSITVVSTIQAPPSLPDGVAWEVHDPDDRPGMAYLSATSDGQRVYLNRTLTDADIVIPIGTLGYDSTLGYRGPWSVIYPGLSDREALARFARQATDEPPDHERPRAALRESAEVSWLLGCQFQIGVVPGVAGVGSVIAGLESAVREAGPEAVDAAWSFRVADRADLVVAGVGAPGRPTSIEELVEGIANASRLVRRGGQDCCPLPGWGRSRSRPPPDRPDRGSWGRPRGPPRARGRPRLPGRPRAGHGPGLGRCLSS